MAKSDKIVSGILLGHGVLGCVWVTQMAPHYGYSPVFLVPNLALTLIGVVAGIGCLLSKRWAAYLGLVFWGIQTIQVLTPTFQFSFTLGLNAILSAGWFGLGQFGLNVFALVLFCWLAVRIKAFGSSFSAAAREASTT
jgi:hypothetical protein